MNHGLKLKQRPLSDTLYPLDTRLSIAACSGWSARWVLSS